MHRDTHTREHTDTRTYINTDTHTYIHTDIHGYRHTDKRTLYRIEIKHSYQPNLIEETVVFV